MDRATEAPFRSTFPRWLDEFGVRRTRKVVDRLIRVIKAGLRSDEMALPRLTLRTERYGWIKDKKITLERIVERWPNFMLERDLDLWRRVREFAERNYEKFCRPLSLEEIDRLASASDIE